MWFDSEIEGKYELPIKMMKKSVVKDELSKEISSSSSKIDQNMSLRITSLTTAISGSNFDTSFYTDYCDLMWWLWVWLLR